jgi:hypothetical protein
MRGCYKRKGIVPREAVRPVGLNYFSSQRGCAKTIKLPELRCVQRSCIRSNWHYRGAYESAMGLSLLYQQCG